jgi:outer membrane protein assembly factor BamB
MTARFLSAALLLGLASSLQAEDWPMDRHDPQRSGASSQELAPELHLHWVRELPALEPAWPDQPKMQFDAAYVPVVLGKTLFLSSSREDSVTAYDAQTGEEKWKFLADGPVRFAPVAWEGMLYFVADDGYLYCLDAETGTTRWKFRGGPSDRKILGNERLISTWPARGAPVVADGKVYFAASIWPFMGIFIHALDAHTGQVVWTNDGDGSIYIQQPHHADAFAGVAPQGALVAVGDRLLVPGGRSVPACLDRHTGKLLHFQLADNSAIGGGSDVAASGEVFANGGELFDLATGDHRESIGQPVVLDGDTIYSATKSGIQARVGKSVTGSIALPGVQTLIKAGSRLYAGTTDRVCAVELSSLDHKLRIAWQTDVAHPAALAAADDRLFVAGHDGRVYCFGPEAKEARTFTLPAPAEPPSDAWTEKARSILETTHVRDSYCIAWGVGTGRLIAELARQSRLHVIAVEPDRDRVEMVRRQLLQAGLHGKRVAVLQGSPDTVSLPPYLAGLMVSEDLEGLAITDRQAFLKHAYESLRPFGGVACLPVPAARRSSFTQMVAAAGLVQAQVKEAGEWLLLSREGALPGAADWTHEHADAGNTRVSKDQLVRAPLGILWFGGPTHEGILPRHGHGPQPQVVEGRLIIEGMDLLRAVDIYTGRLLWETELPGIGQAFNNTSHQPGSNASGSNFVSTHDGIYACCGKTCVRLDPGTGKRMAEFTLPTFPGEPAAVWGHVNVWQDYLVGAAEHAPENPKSKHAALSTSKHLVVLNRHTGQVLWTATAHSGFRHNAIVLGGGRLYAIDRPSVDFLGRALPGQAHARPRLVALDLATGREVWSTEEDVFGTWLSYSARFEVLIECGRVARDTLNDEPHGMRAYQATRGTVLWYKPTYDGPAMISGQQILKGNGACDLLTGAPVLRTDPLTGQSVEWTWGRGYGCNTPMASTHLLTFRSGAAGYFDRANDGGTGNFGGFRSSCTNNLLVAGGVLVAPEYTRTCTCSYQNQTSLALVHMPENEMWTYVGSQSAPGPIHRVGINLGAPGARKSADGTLWLEYPHAGGPSPTVSVRTAPDNEKLTLFRHHASQVHSDLPWVGASGAKGIHSLTVTLDKEARQERTFTVRLYFIEPDALKPGDRVFDIALQGKPVLDDLDIVREVGGSKRSLVKEFKGIRVSGDLNVTLSPTAAAKIAEPVLCGVEVIAEK